MAKIILLECCTKYDQSRGVPFASYYKITLYNAYANHKKKKEVPVIEITEGNMGNTMQDFEYAMKRELFAKALSNLNQIDQKILIRICEGFTHEQIANELHLSKKTILNRKYVAIQKLKEILG